MSYHVGEDFWPEILQWLPVKSLVRFRCVCRSWNSLISSPSFIARHLSCSGSKPRLLASRMSLERPFGESYLLLDSESRAATYFPPFDVTITDRDCSDFVIVGTVNGVICLCAVGYNVNNMDLGIRPSFALWNPLINKYIELPSDEVPVRFVYPRGFWFGFGLKASENDFRILSVSRNVPDSDRGGDDFRFNFIVHVCSVHDGIWRDLPAEILNHCTVQNTAPQCLVNGVLHLVAFDGAEMRNSLLSFDFEQEVFSSMALPQSVSSNVDVAVYKGKLAALDYVRPHNMPCCKIWSMEEYGDPMSWVCVFSVNLSALTRELNQLEQRIAGFTADGRIIIVRGDCALMSYDSAGRGYHMSHMTDLIRQIYACGFVESLIFMDGESKARSLPS